MGKEILMIFEVRILDDKGKMKKRLTTVELSRRHWKTFEEPISFAVKNGAGKKISKPKIYKLTKAKAS